MLGKTIKRKQIQRHIFSLFIIFSVLFSIAFGVIQNLQIAASGGAVRGTAGDLWGDIELGKRDFTEDVPREVVPDKVSSPGGVIVDRSVSPGRAYIWDSGNSRIIGID